MTQVRLYTEKQDYPTIASWWQEQGCHVPHASQLDTLGVMVSVDDEDVAYICAYLAVGVGVAHLDHLVTNPAFKSPTGKLRAVKAMMSAMLTTLRDNDYQLVKAVTWSKTLSKICTRKLGFKRVGGDFEQITAIL